MLSVASRLKLRVSVPYAVVTLLVSWGLLALAATLDIWQLAFLPVLLAAGGTGWDVSEEGYFYPTFLFGAFALLMSLVGMVWMAVYMRDDLLFFQAYRFFVEPRHVLSLASEQLLLTTALYMGYVLVRGLGAREVEFTSVERRPWGYMWMLFYLTGLGALLYLIVDSGGFGALFNSMGEKYERAANRGWLVLLTYASYVGVLLWYENNIRRPAWWRYGGVVALSLPLLLTGSRTEMIIVLLAAGFLDERLGRKANLKILVPAGLLLTLLLVVYQVLRGGVSFDFFAAISKDLSMGTGYAIAVQENIIGDGFRPATLLLTFASVMPGGVEAFLGIPGSPNLVFTDALSTAIAGTLSMGVMGEANYVFPYGWSFIYYLVVGVALTWVGSSGWKVSLLTAAVIAGATIRIAKGGITAGGSNIMQFLLPLAFAYLLVALLRRLYGKSTESVEDPN